jgi:prepilin-type processing-associated H-X9-DG protein
MYAEENGGVFPPRSPLPNHWAIDINVLYPDYLQDPSIYFCPYHPEAEQVRENGMSEILQRTRDLDCLQPISYTYTGYFATNRAELKTVFRAFNGDKKAMQSLTPLTLSVEDDVDGYNTNAPPIMWDQLPMNMDRTTKMRHNRSGANVLFRDGHVEFVPVRDKRFPVVSAVGNLFASEQPVLPEVCNP